MSDTTITIDTLKLNKWYPNQEGQRFKEFIALKKKENESLDENQISDQSSKILSQCMNPSIKLDKFSGYASSSQMKMASNIII